MELTERLDKALEYALENNIPAIAFLGDNDIDEYPQVQMAVERKSSPVKVFYGLKVSRTCRTMTRTGNLLFQKEIEANVVENIIVLIKNDAGKKNLFKQVTDVKLGNVIGEGNRSCVSLSILSAYRDGLLINTPTHSDFKSLSLPVDGFIGIPEEVAKEITCARIFDGEKHYPKVKDGDIRLRRICEAALEEKYETGELEAAKSRLEWELAAIKKTGSAFVFLYLKDLISDLSLTPGEIVTRGNASASIVLFLCGITDIDPLESNLSPEFLYGYEGDKVPFFDISVPSYMIDEARKLLGTYEGMGIAIPCGRMEIYKNDPNGELFLVPEGENIIERTPLMLSENEKICTCYNTLHLNS